MLAPPWPPLIASATVEPNADSDRMRAARAMRFIYADSERRYGSTVDVYSIAGLPLSYRQLFVDIVIEAAYCTAEAPLLRHRKAIRS